MDTAIPTMQDCIYCMYNDLSIIVASFYVVDIVNPRPRVSFMVDFALYNAAMPMSHPKDLPKQSPAAVHLDFFLLIEAFRLESL